MNTGPRKFPQGLTSYTLAALCDRILNGEQSAQDVRTLALAVHDLIAADDDEITELKTRLAEYEGAICWDTACLNCASVLDKSYEEYVRREKAEAVIARVRALQAEWADIADKAGPEHLIWRLVADSLAAALVGYSAGTPSHAPDPDRAVRAFEED